MNIDITTTISATISIEDLEKIIIEYMKKEGFSIEAKNIHFEVSSREEYGDYSPTYYFKEVQICKIEKTNN